MSILKKHRTQMAHRKITSMLCLLAFDEMMYEKFFRASHIFAVLGRQSNAQKTTHINAQPIILILSVQTEEI